MNIAAPTARTTAGTPNAMTTRTLTIALAISVALTLWLVRYEYVPAHSGAAVFRINRLTGTIALCSGYGWSCK
jgi:hypothetical protein